MGVHSASSSVTSVHMTIPLAHTKQRRMEENMVHQGYSPMHKPNLREVMGSEVNESSRGGRTG